MLDTFKAVRIDKDDETQKVNLVELNENLDFKLVEWITTNSEYHHFLTDHKQGH